MKGVDVVIVNASYDVLITSRSVANYVIINNEISFLMGFIYKFRRKNEVKKFNALK